MKKHRIFRGILGFLIIAAVAGYGRSSGAELHPYLQAVTADSIFVLVETRTASPVRVLYGRSALDQTVLETIKPVPTAYPATYVHRIRLTGLSAHTVYHYRAVQNGLESDVHRFITAALPGTAFRFAWMADSRSNVPIHEAVAALMRAASPAFSLYGGDLSATPERSRWIGDYFTPNERALIAEVPFFLSAGNHEGWEPNTKAYVMAPDSGSGTAAYFSFDYGDAHFLAINNELSIKPESPQYKFIQADLAAAGRTWIIVFAHHPAYCAGGHGEDGDMIDLSRKVFKPAGVDLVIAGHSHFYQHNQVDGIHHLVIGSAGAELHTPGNAAYTLKSVKKHNFAIADVTPHTLHLQVYDERGEVLDTLDLRK